MKILNKKGFTLIELLAVIVILAIIMVIATQSVTKAIENSRLNAFESSYKMIVKEVKSKIMEKQLDSSITVECDSDCYTKYGISSEDYNMIIGENSGNYLISISGKGKFDGLDLNSIVSDISDNASVVGDNIAMAINSTGKELVLTDDEKEGLEFDIKIIKMNNYINKVLEENIAVDTVLNGETQKNNMIKVFSLNNACKSNYTLIGVSFPVDSGLGNKAGGFYLNAPDPYMSNDYCYGTYHNGAIDKPQTANFIFACKNNTTNAVDTKNGINPNASFIKSYYICANRENLGY